MLLEPLQPGEIDLAAELDGVGAIRDRDIVLDQRLVLMIVLDEFQSSKDDLLGVSYIRTSVGRRRASSDSDAAWRRGSAHDGRRVGDHKRWSVDVRNRAVSGDVTRNREFVEPARAAVVPDELVAILVVAVPARGVDGREAAVDLQVRFIAGK